MNPLQCQFCDHEPFSRSYHLWAHINTKHLDDFHPFICKVCGKAYARQHDLIEHHQVKHDNKRYVCRGGCEHEFTRLTSLQRHLKRFPSGGCREKRSRPPSTAQANKSRRLSASASKQLSQVKAFGFAAQDRLAAAMMDLGGQRALNPDGAIDFELVVSRILDVAIQWAIWLRFDGVASAWQSTAMVSAIVTQVIYGQLLGAARQLLQQPPSNLMPLSPGERRHQFREFERVEVAHPIYVCVFLLVIYGRLIGTVEEHSLHLWHFKRLIYVIGDPLARIIGLKFEVLSPADEQQFIGVKVRGQRDVRIPIFAEWVPMRRLEQTPTQSWFPLGRRLRGGLSLFTQTEAFLQHTQSDGVLNPEKFRDILTTVLLNNEDQTRVKFYFYRRYQTPILESKHARAWFERRQAPSQSQNSER
jgi:hypothetical protein